MKEVLEVLIVAAQRGMRSESISGRGRLFTEWKRTLFSSSLCLSIKFLSLEHYFIWVMLTS